MSHELLSRDTCFSREYNIEFNKFGYKFGSGNLVCIQMASKEDVFVINEMMYEAAQEGRGFAMDEFNVDGMFSGKLLRKATVICAKDCIGTILAAVVFGPTNFCRSSSTKILGVYMVVNPRHQRQGVGQEFSAVLLHKLQGNKYVCPGVITDVFNVDSVAMQFARCMKFCGIGCIVESGTMKNYGKSDSQILFLPTPYITSLNIGSKL